MTTPAKSIMRRALLVSACVAIAATGCTPNEENKASADAETAGADVVRIVPLGDSLTFGTAADFSGDLDGGYRLALSDRLGEAGYEVDFQGTMRNGPEGFDGDHVSEPGASIAVIAENWAAAAKDVDPDLVLLMAGTNDQLGITADQEPQPAAEALGALIDQILVDAPNARVVVATLPPLSPSFLVADDKPARIDAFNALLPGLVAARHEGGASVFLADLSDIDADLFGDGIHPSTMEGYDTMAQRWYPAVMQAIESR